jgi:Flp pilus assembly protein CpaB
MPAGRPAHPPGLRARLGLAGRRPSPAPSARLVLGSTPAWWHARPGRRARWAAAAVLAVAAVGLVTSATSRAHATLAGYGHLERVAVTTHRLDPGAVVGSGDVTWRELPPAAIAAEASTDSPVGRTVVAPMAAGEVVSRLRLAPDGLGPLAALVPAGDRAVAIPLRPSSLPLQPGDRVDVVAPRPAAADRDGGAGRGGGATVVARAAPVLRVQSDSVVVAVPQGEREAVAAALAQGTPVLALVGAR